MRGPWTVWSSEYNQKKHFFCQVTCVMQCLSYYQNIKQIFERISFVFFFASPKNAFFVFVFRYYDDWKNKKKKKEKCAFVFYDLIRNYNSKYELWCGSKGASCFVCSFVRLFVCSYVYLFINLIFFAFVCVVLLFINENRKQLHIVMAIRPVRTEPDHHTINPFFVFFFFVLIIYRSFRFDSGRVVACQGLPLFFFN